MPFDPQDVVYPRSRIKRVVKVLHNGVKSGNEFSLAQLELHDGKLVLGFRHDMSWWNENNPDVGYPTCRPGNPTWFLLPDIQDLMPVLTDVFGTDGKKAI